MGSIPALCCGKSPQKPHKNNQREKTSRAGCGTYSRQRPGVKEKQPEKPPKMRDLAGFGPAGRGIRSMKPTGSRLVNPGLLKGRAEMAEDTLTTAGIGRHGATRLPSVDVDNYNIELKDDDGFLGDRASKGAFQKILDSWRRPLKKNGEDPFGKKATEEIGKST